MNTTEIQPKGKIKSFQDLWKYAKIQFLAYEKIEGIDDWKTYDFSIDCAADQMKFKDMLQIRCIEELTEATHALDDREHFLEEVTDSLNFFLSAYTMLGEDLSSFPSPDEMLSKEDTSDTCSYEADSVKIHFWYIVDDIGDLCNLLKNRPWAQSNYLVSVYDFDVRLKKLWITFWNMLGWLGLNREKVFILFEKKYEVNRFRMRTGY